MWNWCLEFVNRSEIWQASLLHRCQAACRIVKRHKPFDTQSREFANLRDLVIRHHIGYQVQQVLFFVPLCSVLMSSPSYRTLGPPHGESEILKYRLLLFAVMCMTHISPTWKNTISSEAHYSDVIMSVMRFQITSFTIVYSTVYSGEDKRKHQSASCLAVVRRIHRWPVNSPHKGPVIRKKIQLMTPSCIITDREWFQL